jgi:hypothetical protein
MQLRTGNTTPGTEWAGASLPSGVVLGGRRSGDLGRDVPHRRVPGAQTGPCGEQGADVPEGVEGRAMGDGDDPVGREQRGEFLRHSRIALTMEIYTQIPDKVTRDTLRRLGDQLASDPAVEQKPHTGQPGSE